MELIGYSDEQRGQSGVTEAERQDGSASDHTTRDGLKLA